jgi:hypothetical protein
MERAKMGFVLKLKSLIYKYTGVFLAHKEENEFLDSEEYWKAFLRMATHKENDMSPRNIHGLQIGMWQAARGFARPASFIKYKRPGFIFKPIGWFADLYTVIKWDLIYVYRRFIVPSKPEPQVQLTQSVKLDKPKRIVKKSSKPKKGKKK